ncbi:MAG: hypothetical protein LBG66_05620, partial [Gallionellaceae bacterium]|nr:hypothetical protein [Gallionellaceae bacterium]
MSQPVGIIAKISFPEDNYKKYRRTIAAAPLAAQISACLLDDDVGDYFIFRYLKKESALYALFYFRYGGGDFLRGHPLLAMLQEIEPFLDDSSAGYLLATLDMLNLVENDELVYAATIRHQKFAPHQFTEEESKAIEQDALRHFFKHADENFSLAFDRRQIIDKTVRAKVLALQEAHALQNLKNNLHTATEEKPFELFHGYFYDGEKFYTFVKWPLKQVVFENINVRALRKTPYGLCDDKSVIVGERQIVTPPEKFKLHQKGETIFYSSAEAVYNEKLEPYPDSDGLTFKLKSKYVGEDKNYIYFGNAQLPKQQIGDYEICDAGYFTSRVLLYSSTQVRTPDHILTEIDAPTFAIIHPDLGDVIGVNPSGVFRGCMIVHGRDKHGELVIHNYNIYENPTLE